MSAHRRWCHLVFSFGVQARSSSVFEKIQGVPSPGTTRRRRWAEQEWSQHRLHSSMHTQKHVCCGSLNANQRLNPVQVRGLCCSGAETTAVTGAPSRPFRPSTTTDDSLRSPRGASLTRRRRRRPSRQAQPPFHPIQDFCEGEWPHTSAELR